jgi:hypothetical protein
MSAMAGLVSMMVRSFHWSRRWLGRRPGRRLHRERVLYRGWSDFRRIGIGWMIHRRRGQWFAGGAAADEERYQHRSTCAGVVGHVEIRFR